MSPHPPGGTPGAVTSTVPAEEPKPLISTGLLPDPPMPLPAMSDSSPSSAGAVAEAAAAAVAASPPLPRSVTGLATAAAASGDVGTSATETGMGSAMPTKAVASIASPVGVPATTPPPAGGDESQFATHAVLMQQQQQIHSLEVQLASSQAEIARLRRIARGSSASMPSFGTASAASPLADLGAAAALGFAVGSASPATGLPPEPAPPPPVVAGLPSGVPLGGRGSSIPASAALSSGALSLPGVPSMGDPRPVSARGPSASSPSLIVSAALPLPTATGGLPSSVPLPSQPPAGVSPPRASAGAASRAGSTTAVVPAGSVAVTPGSGAAAAATAAAPAATASAAAPVPAAAATSGPKKGGTSRYWTAEEHARFLDGLRQFGAKDIKGIARHVGSRSATQVRTHQQKYNLRLLREKEKANSANGGSAGSAAAGTVGAAGAASSSSTPSPSLHGGGSHAGGNTASSAGATGARRAGGAAAATNASATAVATPAVLAGKDAKPAVGLSPGGAAGRGTAVAGSGLGAPPGSLHSGMSSFGAAARASGTAGPAASTGAAAAAPMTTDKRPGGLMARKGQSPKRSRAGKRARSSSAPVTSTPAGGALAGATDASASPGLSARSGAPAVAAALGMTPTGAGLTVAPNGGAATPASLKDTAMSSGSGALTARDGAVVSGDVGADVGVKVHGGGDNLGGIGAVGGLDETHADLLLGGRPPLRRSGSSSVLLSELPFLQRPLVSSSGFALPRNGTGAICGTAGVAAAVGTGATGSTSAAVAAAGTPAGLSSATVRRSNSVLSLLSGMPTLRGLAESPSSERLLGLVPPELNDVDGSHVYRNGGPALSMAGAGVGGGGGLGFGIGIAPGNDHSAYVVGSFDHLAGLSAVEDLEEPQAVAMQLQDAKWS
ncbi:hypothetical protein I4F81_011625 [Pyropia yezoensis]|uniref:Uncharacterized protein n=1 Tax=Pyropia yezoensis TaxID=2788 RepID=A0ACC3CH13_PYRYE|nr:hypothetical protein I4F81_011625 [Neopyropia yezoensis]